jgi:hypothetical protein
MVHYKRTMDSTHRDTQVVAVDIDEAAALHSAQRLRLEGCQATAFQCDTTMQEDVSEWELQQ